jgi:hypothetical protein
VFTASFGLFFDWRSKTSLEVSICHAISFWPINRREPGADQRSREIVAKDVERVGPWGRIFTFDISHPV